jgi:hypothetical protein
MDYITAGFYASYGEGYCNVNSQMSDAIEFIRNFYFNSPIFANQTTPSVDDLDQLGGGGGAMQMKIVRLVAE